MQTLAMALKERKMTVAELSERLGVLPETVIRWGPMGHRPRAKAVSMLAEALQVDERTIIWDEENGLAIADSEDEEQRSIQPVESRLVPLIEQWYTTDLNVKSAIELAIQEALSDIFCESVAGITKEHDGSGLAFFCRTEDGRSLRLGTTRELVSRTAPQQLQRLFPRSHARYRNPAAWQSIVLAITILSGYHP